MKYVLAVDIGTTNTKAVLYDDQLRALAAAHRGNQTYQDKPGYQEQDPAEILRAFHEVVAEVLSAIPEAREHVAYLTFSGAMHSLLLLDQAGKPLTRAILWSDTRAVDEVEAFKSTEDAQAYYQRTGTPIHAMSPFFKLLWFKNQKLFPAETAMCLGIKDYILHFLTGEYLVDYSLASATGLFNIHEMRWDEAALAKATLSSSILPRPVATESPLPLRNQTFLAEVGLPSSVQIVPGASDGCLANLGGFALGERETTVTIGTSGAVRMTVGEPLLDPEGKTFCYYLSPGKWVIGGAVNNGGNVLQWLDEILFEETGRVYDVLESAVPKIGAGSEGLIFMPFLFGERAPYWDGRLTASFVGLKAHHKKAHLVRAVVEGVLFNLREVWERLQTLAGSSTKLVASGGFLRSEVWTQMMADIFGSDLLCADEQDSSCLGAALLASGSAGLMAGGGLRKVHFNPERHEQYNKYYKDYLRYAKEVLTWQSETWQRK